MTIFIGVLFVVAAGITLRADVLRRRLSFQRAAGWRLLTVLDVVCVAATVGAVEIGVHSAFAGATGAAEVAGVFLQAFFGVVAFGFAVLASICVGGPVSTGIREYALVFYGGRYQKLGDLLTPGPRAGIA